MAYMCAACSEVYDNYFTECPKVHCDGLAEDDAVIYVEDVFAPVISMLNKKGYEVKECHFGNPNNNLTGQPYIMDGGDKMLHFCKLLSAHINLALFVKNLSELW